MKYRVECKADNYDQYAGSSLHSNVYYNFVGDFVESDTPEGAIGIAIDCMYNRILKKGFIANKIDGAFLTVNDSDGNVVECYHDFRAIAIGRVL